MIAEDEFGITGTAKLKEHTRSEVYGFADKFIHNLKIFLPGLISLQTH